MNQSNELLLVGKEGWGRSVARYSNDRARCVIASNNCPPDDKNIILKHVGDILIFKDSQDNFFALYYYKMKNDRCYLLVPASSKSRYERLQQEHFYNISPECVKHVSGNKFHPLLSSWTNSFIRKISR